MEIMERAGIPPWMFFVVSIAVFLLVFTILHIVGFVPEVQSEVNKDESSLAESTLGGLPIAEASNTNVSNPSPTRIIVDALDLDEEIILPQSRDIAALDDALLDGVVHYPGSGDLEDGNMFLFGHSSYLPEVLNDSFTVFNKLNDLEEGNIIRIQGNGVENVYRVRSVELVDANEALVSLQKGQKKLTLSTCNSFGEKDERFVVRSDYVGSYSIN